MKNKHENQIANLSKNNLLIIKVITNYMTLLGKYLSLIFKKYFSI